MNKEIPFTGFTSVPSDYECQDGTLAQSHNLINENGALRSILPPKAIFALDQETKVVFIHETPKFQHYILQNTDNVLSWRNSEPESDGKYTDTTLHDFTKDVEIYQVNAIGNTLLVQASDATHYFLWKEDSSSYLYLGTHLPELPISFGLQGQMIRTDEFKITFDAISYETNSTNRSKLTTATDPFCADFTDDNKTKITDQVLSKVNKFIAENATDKGKFIYPFLVRYAYRLYDGSLTMHSSPVLMVCSSDVAPDVAVTSVHGNDNKADYVMARVVGMAHSLDYACISKQRIDMLKNWKDIVRSVDVFISRPIYTYKQSGECTNFIRTSDRDSFAICKLTNQTSDKNKYPVQYQQTNTSLLYGLAFNTLTSDGSRFDVYQYRVGLPRMTLDAVKANIKDCANFYLLKSINLNDLKTDRTVIEVEEDYLQSLGERELMTDDYDSHDDLLPKYSFAYNQRLNVANIKKRLYNLYNAGALLPYTNGYVFLSGDGAATVSSTTTAYSVYFHIKQNGKSIIVGGEGFPLGANSPVIYLYYPNTNCYKATIVYWNNNEYAYEVNMEAHTFLNGAVFISDWEGALKSSNFVGNEPSESSDSQRTVELPNKIYTSMVNNPFVFPVTGINTVGTGRILGISTAAKALSQGQFGQFPLYAFTTDGVWALETNSSGGYSAKQPITRDVCISADSITQIDSSVLFATDRGIMEISGSTAHCITDIINGNDFFALDRLPGLATLYPDGIPQIDCTFSEYRKGARMAYDYINQRIIIFNPDKTYAYVFSIKSKLWGLMASTITSAINSYPEAYAMATVTTSAAISGQSGSGKTTISQQNCLVDLSRSYTNHAKGLIVTRPLKLEGGSILKTLDTVFLRGLFAKGKVMTILYGSRDNINWHLVHSAKEHYLRGFRGSPYKYYRIAAITDLAVGETLVGASVQYSERLTNQLR